MEQLTNKINVLERALQRQKSARKEAEKILEKKSLDLYNTTQELKKANNKLEGLLTETTSELEGVFANIIDAYIVMDVGGNVIKLNDEAIKMLGYDINVSPLNLMNIVKKDYLEYTQKAFSELYSKGIYRNFRVVIITKEKEEKLVQVNSSIIYNKDGKPIAAQGILRDITQEESVKELIEQQKKQLDIVIDHSPIGICLSNKDDSGIIMANNSLCKMLGYTPEELKSIKLQDVTHTDEKEISNAKREQLYKGEFESYSLDKRYIKKSGEVVWARTSVTGVKNSLKEVKYHVTTIEDITKEKKLEAQKEELLKNLENQNEQLNDYAHIVSHDLKSPLRSISALLSWTKEDLEGRLTEDNLVNLNLMEGKVEKMDKLIGDILSYSSLQRDEINFELVDFNEIIQNIVDILHIPDHISVKIIEKLPVLMGDSVRLQQLFQNLISNSINYMDKEVGLIEIKAVENEQFFVFSVKDNAAGIPKEDHEKIFKVFNTVGTHETSSGIGLSIVEKVVDLHKGKIWLESEPGIGTTFFFSIKK